MEAENKKSFIKVLIFVLGFLVITSGAYFGYRYFLTVKELKEVKTQFASSTIDFENKIKQLEDELNQTKNENTNLNNSLLAERAKNEFFEEQINAIQGTVNTLNKLSKTDRELLKKYSKVYFLNENYVPAELAEIDERYLYNNNHKDKPIQIHAKVKPYLYKMLESASSSGVNIKITSAYRSFNDQANLKLSYKMIYGSGANKFSADQGYSEHQLGTAVDLTTPELKNLSLDFEKTTAYRWLNENAYRYGFVISYPRENKYYQFEPWHWRFVGVALATKLHNSHQYFYELDQREIDQYLISIFD